MNVTMRDVAFRAGVSVKTVSRVVNAEPNVKATTRDSVRGAIAELGFRPDSVARTLRTGRTNTLALVVPELNQPFFATIADALAAQASQHELSLVIGVTRGSAAEEEAFVRDRGPALDGVVMYGVAASSRTMAALASVVPLVQLGERDHRGIDRVTMDNEHGIGLVVDHLAAIGCRRIAVVGLAREGDRAEAPAHVRVRAFRAALERVGLTFDESLAVAATPWRRDVGARAARHLLAVQPPPDAIVALNDALALGVLAELGARGVRVPEDIAVTGFDDLPDAEHSVPSLTTVAPDLEAFTRDALALVLARRGEPALPRRVISEPVRLRVRESTMGRSPWPPT